MRTLALSFLLLLAVAAPARGAFVADAPIPVGGGLRDLETADFDGNGRPDLAAAQYTDGKVAVLLNQPGGFAPEGGSPYATAVGANDISIADFTADGRLDIVVTNYASSSWTLLKRGDAGGFAPFGAPAGVNAGYAIAHGDFDTDGDQDVVIGSAFTDAVYVFKNTGGTFAEEAGSPYTTGGHKLGAATGDFNGDGRADIAGANSTGAVGNVSVFLRNGGNTGFGAGASVATGGISPQRLLAADFNGDARPDLAVANYQGDTVSLLLSQGNGTFVQAPGSPYAVGGGPFNLARGDFNGDGAPDLAVGNYDAGSVSLLLNTGGALAPGGLIPLGITDPWGVAAADFDVDGRIDVAVSSPIAGSVTILRNVPDPPPPPDLDKDKDGVQSPVDCRDDDAAIRPGAADAPGDGVDQDCSGSDAQLPVLVRSIEYEVRFNSTVTIFTKLNVKPARKGDRIKLTCKGRGCPRKDKLVRVRKDKGSASLTKYLKGAQLRAGATIELRITRAGTIGRYGKYTMRGGKLPKKQLRCLQPGQKQPIRCPAG